MAALSQPARTAVFHRSRLNAECGSRTRVFAPFYNEICDAPEGFAP